MELICAFCWTAQVTFAAPTNPHYDKMLVEAPTEIQEAPDGNGDTLIYADGTQAETGGNYAVHESRRRIHDGTDRRTRPRPTASRKPRNGKP